MLEKNFGKKNVGKSLDKKHFGKIKYKTKIFLHYFCLASTLRQKRVENVCGI